MRSNDLGSAGPVQEEKRLWLFHACEALLGDTFPENLEPHVWHAHPVEAQRVKVKRVHLRPGFLVHLTLCHLEHAVTPLLTSISISLTRSPEASDDISCTRYVASM